MKNGKRVQTKERKWRFNMKKLKKLAAVLLAGVMMCTALTGCSIGNTAFKYGDIKVSMPEAVLYAQLSLIHI